MVENWKYLDEHLRIRLVDLDSSGFERFFLHLLRADISLTIGRNGQKITRRVVDAQLYNAGSGRDQKGIDILVKVEGGETWVFQCKRRKTWNVAQTKMAIEEAAQYQANHYFLAVACDPSEGVQDEIEKHAEWTFWGLDTICAELRLLVHPSKRASVLFFLPPDELRRFAPTTTEALVEPKIFFERFLGENKTFRHDWRLVGREKEIQELRGFIAGGSVVQIVCARGGEGKSRLLWELCRILEKENPGAEVLCLNPHRLDDNPEFAFCGTPACRVILVDDAHRVEQVPLWLFGLVAQDSKERSSKLILATRPQGVDALFPRMSESSLSEKVAPRISLAPLKSSQIKDLATQALGDSMAGVAQELTRLTGDSPFLTVVAGELLRRGRLQWGNWTSDQAFRQQVFREFEQENLDLIPEIDRDKAKGLIRLLALLAPVKVDRVFTDAAAKCLDFGVFQFETLLNRLRQNEVVAGGDDGLRIVPDLFADSLVYDVCYDPSQKLPRFVANVFESFSGNSAALLRNLSEATWIARANGVAGDVLAPLIEREFRRFSDSSYFQRGEILGHWSQFSIFLPGESLKLAQLAATPHPDGYIRGHIATLLRPVAKYHQDHRHKALDLLWKLGFPDAFANSNFEPDHPWSIIAEVIKYERKKPIEVTLDALSWLEAEIRKPTSQKLLEGKTSVLRLLVRPSFDRIVEWTWWEGRQCHFCRQFVSAEITACIRDRALSILEWIIKHGSSLAALDALSALEPATEQVSPLHTGDASETEKLNKEWLPERLKALNLCGLAVNEHPDLAVRYKVRQLLRRRIRYEKDDLFTAKAHEIIGTIPDDLKLRISVALVSHDVDEVEIVRTNRFWNEEDTNKVALLWAERVQGIAKELAAAHGASDTLYVFIYGLIQDLVAAGYHAWPVALFEQLSEVAPDLAFGLAQQIIDSNSTPPLSLAWTALVEKNRNVDAATRTSLQEKAARSSVGGASAAAIRALAVKARDHQPLTDADRKLLVEIAQRTTDEEAGYLLQFIEWCDDVNMSAAIDVLTSLPIRKLAPRLFSRVLAALYPFRERTSRLPREVVSRVVEQLDTVPDLGTVDDLLSWEPLIKEHPRAVYELLRNRVSRAIAGEGGGSYSPLPFDFHRRLSFPQLANEPDYANICDELWNRVSTAEDAHRFWWEGLFKAVVMQNTIAWRERLLSEIEQSQSEEKLISLTELLRFDGSLVIFQFPEVAGAFLRKGQALRGLDGFNAIRAGLYRSCGPQTRLYSNGQLDPNLDYVEAEAIKAAAANAADELLGPFYRWIVEIEQSRRKMNKMLFDAEMASLD